MARSPFTPAISNALRALSGAPLDRVSGGYGKDWPAGHIPLKTAKRMVDLGYAAVDGKLGGKRSRLLQTESGRVAGGTA